RSGIKDLGFDIPTFILAKNLLLEKKGDNNLLTSLKKYFESKGYIFFNWTKYCKELFSYEANLTKIKPSKKAILNLKKAKSIYQIYKKLDVGQAMIIQNQLVLGLEAIEGTDELLRRCNEYRRKGDNGILLKFSKENQSNLIDIPLIGFNTIKNLKKYNFDGIFLEKNKCLILDKKKIIDYANYNNLFISSVDLN
ncbi:UDP-2,3-diacylglucosamine diphosphatase LpxI, partial [Pelagibacteraceae bacterium]|nr:UDP-2,3-diacylglucosamine diphosphatase LpxI [Pelagibacteraceae bacterium]